MDAKEDGVVTNPFTKQTRRANKVAIDLAKTGTQAKVALAVMELWMSATHAGDVVGILLGAWLWKIFVFKLASLF